MRKFMLCRSLYLLFNLTKCRGSPLPLIEIHIEIQLFKHKLESSIAIWDWKISRQNLLLNVIFGRVLAIVRSRLYVL